MTARTAYLEHDVASAYERVWAELWALGTAVREEPLYRDALAVARETMRRVCHKRAPQACATSVRHTSATLILRLEALG